MLGVTLLGFGGFSIIQTILPLYVVALGGSATLVGFVVAAFSLPSVVLRPFIGRWVDERSRRAVYLVGTFTLGLAGFLYLVPHLAFVLLTRVLHGTGWAAFNTAGGTILADLAPPSRRGEAAGIYNLMPGVANMAMPTIGLVLLTAGGFALPFAVAALFGLLAAALLGFGPLPPDRPRARRRSRFWSALVERTALLPMSFEFLFALTSTLFWVYPPLFAQAMGIPLADLAGYYVPVGVALVMARIVVGRLLDRMSRATALLAGALSIASALVVASLATGVVVLAAAGILYALASSFVTPAAMAAAIDRAPDDRRGSAIATYSLGYQLAVGTGGFLWGGAIDAFGFPAPYVLALTSPALLAAVALTKGKRLTGSRSETQ